MPTVSQHYGHHAAPRTDKSALATRQAAAPVVLMVSGGADSTALLLMACTSKLDIQDGRGVDGIPALMVRGLENIPRALLECVVRVHTAVCGRLSTRKGCHGFSTSGYREGSVYAGGYRLHRFSPGRGDHSRLRG